MPNNTPSEGQIAKFDESLGLNSNVRENNSASTQDKPLNQNEGQEALFDQQLNSIAQSPVAKNQVASNPVVTPSNTPKSSIDNSNGLTGFYKNTLVPIALQGLGLGSINNTIQSGNVSGLSKPQESLDKAKTFADNVNRAVTIDGHNSLASTLALYNKAIPSGPNPIISNWISTNYNKAKELEQEQQKASDNKTLGPVANFVSQNPITSALLVPVAGEVAGAAAVGGIAGAVKSAGYIGSVGVLYNTLNSLASKYIDTSHDPASSQEELETNLVEHAGVNIGGAILGGVGAGMGLAASEAKNLGSKIMSPLKNILSKRMDEQASAAQDVLQLNQALKGVQSHPIELSKQADKMNYGDIVQTHNENANMFNSMLNKNIIDPENPNFAPDANIAQLSKVQSILENSTNPSFQQNSVQLKNAIENYKNNQKVTTASFDTFATSANQNPEFQNEANKMLESFRQSNPNATITDLPPNLKTQTLFNYAKNISGDTAKSIRAMITDMEPENAANIIQQHIAKGAIKPEEGTALQSFYDNTYAKNQTMGILNTLTQKVTTDPNLMELDQKILSINPNINGEELTNHLVNNGIVTPVASQISRNIMANNFISQYADHLMNNKWNAQLDSNFAEKLAKYKADAQDGLFLRETTDKLNQLSDMYNLKQKTTNSINETTNALGQHIKDMSNSLGVFNDAANSGRIDSLLDIKGNNRVLANNFKNLFDTYKTDLTGKQYNAWENHTTDNFQKLYANSLNPENTVNKDMLVEQLKSNPISQQLSNTILTTAKALNNKLPGSETSVLGTKDGAFVLSEMGRLLDRDFVNSLSPVEDKKMSEAEIKAFEQEKLNEIYDSLGDRLIEQNGSIKPTLETLSNFNDIISKRASGYEVHPQQTLSNVQYKGLQQLLGNSHSDLRKQMGTDYYRSIGYDKPGEAEGLVQKLNTFYGKFKNFEYDFNKQTGLHLSGLPEENKISQLAETLQQNEGTPYQWVEDNIKPLHGAAQDFFNTLHQNDPLMQNYLANKFTLTNQDISRGMARSISSQIANDGKTPLTPQALKIAIANSNDQQMQKMVLINPRLGGALFRDMPIERNGNIEPYKGLLPTSEIISNLMKLPDTQVNMKIIQQNYPELYTHLQSSFRDKIVADAAHMGTIQPEVQLTRILTDTQKYAQTFGEHFTNFADSEGKSLPNLSVQELTEFARKGLQDPEGVAPYLRYINSLGELSQFNTQLKDLKNAASTLGNPTISQENKSILINHIQQVLDNFQTNIDNSSNAVKYNEKELNLIKEPLKEIQGNLGDMNKVADGLLKLGEKSIPFLQKNIIDAQKEIQQSTGAKHSKLSTFMNAFASPVKRPIDYISSIAQSYMSKQYQRDFPDVLNKTPAYPYGLLQDKAAIKSIGDAIQNKEALANYYDSVNKTKLTKKNAALMTALMGAMGSH